MLRLIAPIILMLIGLGAGVSIGGFFKSSEGVQNSAEPEDGNGSDASDEEASTQGNDGSQGDGGLANGSVEYVRLNNQFIVPVIRHGTVRSLVVLSLTVEVPAGQNTIVFEREPRLRDAFLRVLFAHANSGGFDGSFTSSLAMAPLRIGLKEAAVGILGQDVSDVLIVDIVRQDT
ncbi:MAG: flagellar FliL protein [Paracoccaceae bacterium]|jgi:hypothetical protein